MYEAVKLPYRWGILSHRQLLLPSMLYQCCQGPRRLVAHSAQVMLTSNLWVDVDLVNEAVQAIRYKTGGPALTATLAPPSLTAQSPSLLLSLLVRPVLTTPAAPQAGVGSNHPQFQGLTLDKVVIDVGKRVLHRLHICCRLSCPSAAKSAAFSYQWADHWPAAEPRCTRPQLQQLG